MRLTTPFGEQANATRKGLEEALDAIQRHPDGDVFLVVERDDGTFLQMKRLPIELGGGPWDKPRRASLPADVRAMFLGFAEGATDWDRGVAWLEDPPPPWWDRGVPWWGVLLPFLVLAAIAYGIVAGCHR